MIILRRFGPLFCSLKRVHADIFMLAYTLFNEQYYHMICIGKTKCTNEKGLLDKVFFGLEKIIRLLDYPPIEIQRILVTFPIQTKGHCISLKPVGGNCRVGFRVIVLP